jgi:predicted nucleic acid-binding protein
MPLARTAFADTAFWVALIDRGDQLRAAALRWSQQVKGLIVTTDSVLTETANHFSRPQWRGHAVELIERLSRHSDIRIVPTSEDLWHRGFELYRARLDKAWSLTDCISFVVMQDEGLTAALTSDDHFAKRAFARCSLNRLPERRRSYDLRDRSVARPDMLNELKNVIGGIVGGAVGYFVFAWCLKYGFYAMIAPGGLLGIGASFYRHRLMALPFVSAVAALVLGFFAEWKKRPFAKDDSLGYFVSHLTDLTPVTWIMILVGAALAFYFPYAQYRKAVLPGSDR